MPIAACTCCYWPCDNAADFHSILLTFLNNMTYHQQPGPNKILTAPWEREGLQLVSFTLPARVWRAVRWPKPTPTC
jgi:hypothetical protein